MLLLKSLIALFLAAVNFHNSSIMQAVILPQGSMLADGQIVLGFPLSFWCWVIFQNFKKTTGGLCWAAVYVSLLAFRQWNNIRQLCPQRNTETWEGHKKNESAKQRLDIPKRKKTQHHSEFTSSSSARAHLFGLITAVNNTVAGFVLLLVVVSCPVFCVHF